MKITPNLGPTFRIVYAVLGLVLIAASFVLPLETWARVALPVLGGISILTGATGW